MQLAKYVLAKLEGQVTELNLEREQIQPLNRGNSGGKGMQHWLSVRQMQRYYFDMPISSKQMQLLWQPLTGIYLFPAMVKNYLEAVTVCGVTFKYTPEGIPTGAL